MSEPKQYRKKPVVIEAMQFTSGFAMRAADWCQGEVFLVSDKPPSSVYELRIYTLEGWMTAKDGDWIIKGVQGEFYPCKPDIFAATYEAVSS